MGLSALGLALSAYLSWHYVVGGSVIGCGGGNPCDQVLNSRWSSIGGVLPVSGLAAGTYLAMLVASLFIGSTTETQVRRLAWSALQLLVGAAAGGAVWFIIVQKWVIGSFCPYCMATHITSLLLATLIIWQAPRQLKQISTDVAPPESASAPTSPQGVIGRGRAIGLTLVGLALAAVMAACQVHFVPPAVFRGGESQKDLPAIDPHAAPLIGSPDAPYIVNLLFDYNCPHCQQLHFMLNEAVRRYHGKLAFILCPTPLNPKCNPYIPREVAEFEDSCELARIALTVWVAQRESFAEFDLWMFSLDSGDFWRPRRLAAARAKAVELVGQAKFDAAQSDPWIGQYLQASISVYGNTAQGGNTAVPKMVFGSHWVIPQPDDADELISILHDSLALPTP